MGNNIIPCFGRGIPKSELTVYSSPTFKEFLDSPHKYRMIRVRWDDAVDDFLKKSRKEPDFDRLWGRLQFQDVSDDWWTYSPMGKVGGDWFGLIEMYPDAWLATMLNGPEDYVVSKAKLTCVPIAYATPDNDIFGVNMDNYLYRLSRFGILRFLRKVSRESSVKVSDLLKEANVKAKGKGSEATVVLDVKSLLSVFFIWGVGCSIALVSFCGELLLTYFGRNCTCSFWKAKA